MEASTNRPRVFVSSTIFDFRDLRGSIKYWLEELGLQVEMSEFTDFGRRPNQGAFRSCFGVIERCDFFVLLIGGRRGSWYRKDDVSVTQQEYRVASELAKQGRIKLVILAREEVLAALREWKSFGKPLGHKERKISGRMTIEDPGFTERFLEEVRGTELETKGGDPSGAMWIYHFRDFRDVAEVLRNNLQLYGSIPRQTLLANLRWELIDNIASMSTKGDDLPRPGYWWLEDVRKNIQLDSHSPIQLIRLTPEDANNIVLFVVFGTPGNGRLRTVALGDAIRSREFLSFNQAENRLEPSKVLELMYTLLGQIETHQSAYQWWWQTNLDRVVGELRLGIASGNPQISEFDLLFIFGFYDRLVNITRLSIALLDFIDDQSRDVDFPNLIDPSPYGTEESERVKAETVRHQDVEDWLKFEMTRRNLTREQRRFITASEKWETFNRFPTLWDIYARRNSMTKDEAIAQLKLRKDVLEKFESEGFEAGVQLLRDRRRETGTQHRESATES